MKINLPYRLVSITVLVLLAVSPAFSLSTTSAQSSSFSNPSVISSSAALLNGPRVSAIKFPIFLTDSSNVGSLVSGQTQIIDIEPDDPTLTQTMLSDTNLNVTSEQGSSEVYILFNMYNATAPNENTPPGFFLPFRQAFAHLVNYTYVQNTVLQGFLGQASANIELQSSFGSWATNNINVYQNDLTLANQSLTADPQIVWVPSAVRPNTGFGTCDGHTTGTWEYRSTLGTGSANTTVFEPGYITRPDHLTWFETAQYIVTEASSIGLCFNLIQVHGFGNVYPIVYAQYSQNWAIYDGGASFTNPINPINNLYFTYSTAGWVTPFDNTVHFYNATINGLLNDMYLSSGTNVTHAEADSQQAITDLSQQIPQLQVWWDSVIIGSLNNLNGHYWSGYVDTPAYSTWSVGSGFYTSLNVHQVDPTTGNTIVGGTFGVAQHEAPDDYNPFQATSVYDFDILNDLGFFDSPAIALPTCANINCLVPWMTTSMPTYITPVNMTTPHGYNLVNGMEVTLNFMHNITWADNVPFTANDYNFSLWYANLNGASYNSTSGKCVGGTCWAQFSNRIDNDFTGLLPYLVDSQVTSPYSVNVYLNASALPNYISTVTFTPFPEHIWAGINTATFNADVNPLTTSVNGTNLDVGLGPFYLSQVLTNSYTLITRNPGYFHTDIQDWSLSGSTGGSVPLSVNLTQVNPGAGASPIPTNSSVSAWLVQNGSPVSGTQTTLTGGSGGTWTGSISTSGLSAGFYEIVVNGTYTDNDLFHTAVQYWGLNLSSGTQTTTSTTTTTPTGTGTSTSTGTSSSTTSSTSATGTGTSSSTSSSSTSTGAGTNYALIAGVVIVIVIIAGTAAYLVRRR